MTITTEHKGLPVRKHSVALRGASGDALNGALKVSPQDFVQGQPVYMVVELMPNGENYKPMDDGEAWEEVEVGKVTRGAFINSVDALPYLDDVTVALADLKANEDGQGQVESLALEADHNNGLHRRRRKNCPLCFPTSDQAIAQADELAARREAHGDGEGDEENPTPPARRYRTKPAGAKRVAKKRAAKKSTKR